MNYKFLILMLAIAVVPALADPPDPPDENVLHPDPDSPGNWYVEFAAGLNLTLVDGHNVVRNQSSFEQPTSIYESASGLGFLGGVTCGYFFTPNIGLGLRAEYDVRYGDNSASTIDTCLVQNQAGIPLATSKAYSIRADYLSISLLGHFNVDNWIFSLGPSVGIPVSGHVQESSTILDNESLCRYMSETSDSALSFVGVNDNVDSIATRVSIKISAAYVYRLSPRLSIVPQIGFDAALTNTYKEHPTLTTRGAVTGTDRVLLPNYNKGIRLNAFQATLGLRFNL